jgi:hypothetical protein
MFLDLEDELVCAFKVGLGVDDADVSQSGSVDHANVRLRQRNADAEEAKDGEEDNLKSVHVVRSQFVRMILWSCVETQVCLLSPNTVEVGKQGRLGQDGYILIGY